MKKIVITGGAGFIGSHFVDYICRKYPDWNTVVIDKLTYAGDISNIESDNIEFYFNDICDPVIVHYLHDADVVINLAAETHVDNSIRSSAEFMQTNILGVHNLLEIVRDYHIPKFIQMSTDEVYGSIVEGSFTENDKLNPGNPYSASKCSGDLLIQSYINTYKIPAIIVRPTNNFGPRQYPEKLIPFFVKRLMEGKTVPVYGDGMNVRDWLYVGDTCAAINGILSAGKVGEIYNIAGENEMSNIVIVKKILEILGLGEDRIEWVKDRLGHDRRYSINSAKLKAVIGDYMPRDNFDENLRNTVLWFKKKFEEVKQCMV